MIVEDEMKNQSRANYGAETLKILAKTLTAELGKGFSRSNLYNMRQFYLCHRKIQTVSGKLSWSHYCELLNLSDESKRLFYEKEAENACWSVRELKRQLDSSLFERLLLSSGNSNKERVLELAVKGNELSKPADMIRDPYVFEFLGIPEDKPLMEGDLEKALVIQIEKFLLELGRGYSFVARQKRITLDGQHFYIDLVFYNIPARCYVLIDLKIDTLTHQDLGQMQMYVNYYTRNMMNPGDNPPVGIVLCAEKNDAVVEYTLPQDEKQIFAAKYMTYLPSKEELKQLLYGDDED